MSPVSILAQPIGPLQLAIYLLLLLASSSTWPEAQKKIVCGYMNL
jgi:hypothetical protein